MRTPPSFTEDTSGAASFCMQDLASLRLASSILAVKDMFLELVWSDLPKLTAAYIFRRQGHLV